MSNVGHLNCASLGRAALSAISFNFCSDTCCASLKPSLTLLVTESNLLFHKFALAADAFDDCSNFPVKLPSRSRSPPPLLPAAASALVRNGPLSARDPPPDGCRSCLPACGALLAGCHVWRISEASASHSVSSPSASPKKCRMLTSSSRRRRSISARLTPSLSRWASSSPYAADIDIASSVYRSSSAEANASSASCRSFLSSMHARTV
mmetsp:Transcript_36766/g.60868  ORF Transcript_36766/g.60868 Transcript_36766/m.60868 type:complete len:208 (-) Transcript_36766:253-876(-)